MNIFKVLSDGDGSINEPNISSFLAYLLDPAAEHGLGANLLSKVIESVVLSNRDSFADLLHNDRLADLSYRSRRFSINIHQELKVLYGKKYKERHIDVVIEVVDLDGNIAFSFPIENKISDASINPKYNQLTEEYEGLRGYYQEKNMKPKIGFIYLTPEPSAKSVNSYIKIAEKYSGTAHVFWRGSSQDDNAAVNISDMLTDILEDESVGVIDPVYDYTKHLLKSFISFVRSDFQSYISEKRNHTSKNDYKRPIVEYIREIFSELHFNVAYDLSDIKKKLSDTVFRESGTVLHNTTRNCQLYAVTVNEPNRRHYGITRPDDESRNLLFYCDAPENSKVMKFDSNNPPQGVEIYWGEGKERKAELASVIYKVAI